MSVQPPSRRRFYRIAGMTLEIQSEQAAAVNAVEQAVRLPVPPAESLTLKDLVSCIKSLRMYAVHAAALLIVCEQGIVPSTDTLSQELRTSVILWGEDGIILGRILGDGQAYGPQGEQLTDN